MTGVRSHACVQFSLLDLALVTTACLRGLVRVLIEIRNTDSSIDVPQRQLLTGFQVGGMPLAPPGARAALADTS